MNIEESIKARIRNYKIKHFDKTKQGKALAQLKGKHDGERCFIIGNGPSLCPEDLTKLHEYKEITFAFNRIYLMFSRTEWRPTYYMSQDKWMLSGCVEEANKVPAEAKFMPVELNWYEDIHIEGAYLYHLLNKEDSKGIPVFGEKADQYIVNSATVVFSAIQLAIYMGFKEIYLIGVDQHFHISRNAKGEIVVDSTAKDYFCDEYNQDSEKLAIPATETSYLAFLSAKDYADAHNIKIYNATRGGKLEVFQRVSFDAIFS